MDDYTSKLLSVDFSTSSTVNRSVALDSTCTFGVKSLKDMTDCDKTSLLEFGENEILTGCMLLI